MAATFLTGTAAAPLAAMMFIERPLPKRLTWSGLYVLWLLLGLALARGIALDFEEQYSD